MVARQAGLLEEATCVLGSAHPALFLANHKPTTDIQISLLFVFLGALDQISTGKWLEYLRVLRFGGTYQVEHVFCGVFAVEFTAH